MTIRGQIQPKSCKRCGAVFVRKKSTAKYCSGTCREAFNDARKAERRRRGRILAKIAETDSILL